MNAYEQAMKTITGEPTKAKWLSVMQSDNGHLWYVVNAFSEIERVCWSEDEAKKYIEKMK
jgi:rubrerythrin